jgi:hypothetical protein
MTYAAVWALLLFVGSGLFILASLLTGAFFSRSAGLWLGICGAVCGLWPTTYTFLAGQAAAATFCLIVVIANFALAAISLGGE